MGEAKNDNLLRMTPEEVKAATRKGGIASGESKRRKKAMQEELIAILNLPVKRKDRKDINGKALSLLDTDKAKALEDFQRQNTTVQTQILLKITEMAVKGDLRAIQLIMDLTVDKTLNVEMNANVDQKTTLVTAEDIAKAIIKGNDDA